MLKKRSYKPVKMFSVPLEDIIVNNQLPEKLQEMLIRLWVDGATTSGIFRLNGNARKIREVKEAIDGRKSVDIADEGIHVISSLLKELLRNVPGGILPSSRYTEFVATNDIADETTRIQQIRKVLGKLPAPNQVFLRYLLPLLHHIAQYEELNKMSTTNLAICFAPSLLEPDYSLAVIKNEAPTLVEFMIRHSMEIYNNELPELFRQADIGPSEASESEREMGPVQYVKVKDDDTSGGGTISSNGSRKYYHQRNLSMESTCTSASEDSFDEDDQSSYQHLSQADGNMTLLSTSSRGQVSLLSGSISTGVEGDMSDNEDDESMGGTYDRTKWPITTRQATGVWSRPPYLDAKSRRHSFVSQSLSTKHYTPDLASSSILGAGGGVGGISPLSRSRNSSHGIGSPMFPHRVDHLDSETTRVGGGGGGVMHPDPGTSNSGSSSSGSARKKRKKPGHSNSFSKSSDLPHIEPRIPQSTSFSYANDYDSLLPAAADSRPRSHTVATSSSSRPLTHSVTGRDTLTTSLEAGGSSSISGPGSRVSSAGMTRSGGWNQQGLSSNRRSGSPDDSLAEFMNTPFSKLNPELIKQTISHRFNLTTTGSTSSTADKKSSPPPAKEDIKSSRLKESSDTKTTPSASKYSSYQQQSSPSHQRQMKRVESVDSTTASIDDRPEAERHLNSLPRSQNSTGSLGRRSMFATSDILSLGYNNQSESGSQLTIGSGAGYSSDTESSPSRTLNRPDKLSEVTGSPYTIPSRYSKYNNDNNTPSPKAPESFDRPPSIEEHSLQKSLDDSSRQSRSSLSYSTRESYVKKRSSLTSQSLSSSKGRHSGGDWEQSDGDRNFTRSLQEPPASGSSSSEKIITLSSKSFDDKIGPMPAPHIGTRQLGSNLASHDHKSRSMPGERNVTRKHTVEGRGTGAVSYVKTERVVRYELPVPKKIRRINLRAYNNAK
ncbi:PREDICTED: uncharacterized protein LOC109581524 [Amphimedon queenslandica]|nr:PREDICTED: uncharacterized protein LOC109581524 [Amphimedon queenslandica]|eukprot:XP_019851263.1 PREDICTED: uncharacterized protein LOC109581524 [Amphimedon queenslandica]